MANARSVLFVVDPLDHLKAVKDSSVAMMRALAARGHDVWACTPDDLRWNSAAAHRLSGLARKLRLSSSDDAWYEVTDEAPRPLAHFDAVLMRKDPPFDTEYLYATHLLQAAQAEGARVFNDPRALRDHNEKFAIAEFAQYSVPTLVTRAAAPLREFHRDHGDIVVKPLDGMGGTSVFRLRADDPNLNVILETVTEFGRRTVMAQRYIPEIRDGDKRVLLIAGEPVPYALARVPRPGETRGNLAAGGLGRSQPLSPRDREIAAALGPVLAARGLLLVGLDIIGDHLTEINVTSPTCFVEITQQTGFDVAGRFADALEIAIGR